MQQTYLEQIEKLYESVKTDTTIPEGDRTEIEETLASLYDLLWGYSA